MITIVMQRLYPKKIVNVLGIFDTIELAKSEADKAIAALMVANPDSYKTRDSQGDYTVHFGRDTDECMQFHFQTIEKNKQLTRTYRGIIHNLKNNGWEFNGEKVFLW